MLKIHTKNSRYFDDGSGKPVYLVSSHTWMVNWDFEKWKKYLDFCEFWKLNSIRMWTWEHNCSETCIWQKTGSGKFDLERLNQAYFDRIYSFVAEADKRNLHVSIMLFQGWSGALPKHDLNLKNWELHPMKAGNNINGINGDPDNKGYGAEIHNRYNESIFPYWEAYVKKMIDTLNSFENIIWEIGNEDPYPPFSMYFINFIHQYEKSKPLQHLVFYSGGAFTGNDALYSSNADVYGPQADDYDWGTKKEIYFVNPPVPLHNKPEILDNDHVGNHLSPYTFSPLDQRNWTWKSFLRGYHPWHMDYYDTVEWCKVSPVKDHPFAGVSTMPQWDSQRKSLGDTLQYANKMKYLADTMPTMDINICSTGYCIYCVGKEYLAYQPSESGCITLDIAPGNYSIEIFNPMDGSTQITSLSNWKGGKKTFEKPSHISEDFVLYIVSEEG